MKVHHFEIMYTQVIFECKRIDYFENAAPFNAPYVSRCVLIFQLIKIGCSGFKLLANYASYLIQI